MDVESYEVVQASRTGRTCDTHATESRQRGGAPRKGEAEMTSSAVREAGSRPTTRWW